MPAFKAYPTVATNPNRKARKGLRSKTFIENKKMTSAYSKRAKQETRGY